MDNLREAILRNCYVGSVDGSDFTVRYNAGYVVFDWPNGCSTRMRKAENNVDVIIPLPDGRDFRIKGPVFGLAA